MKRISLILFSVVLLSFSMVSCSDDDDFSNIEVTNSEFLSFLKDKGYTFTDDGQLVQDDMVMNTTSLDLSGTEISDLSGFDVLPNLTELNLSDNGYGPTFDFSVLPSTLTGVDLTGNEIYEYFGLVDVETQENGDETVTDLQSLTKLYLPESAKYDCSQLVYFYEQNKKEIEAGTVDMEIADTTGTLSTYTTLREVPDETVLAYLKEQFSELFTDDDKIDISKRLLDNATKSISVSGFSNAEGISYVAMNRSYEGGYLGVAASAETSMPYLKIKSSIYTLSLKNINTTVLDLSLASSLLYCTMGYNNTIESLDFSNCPNMGQRGLEEETTSSYPSAIIVCGCPLLKTLSPPEKAEHMAYFIVCNLPKLEKLDLSNIKCLYKLGVGYLTASCDVTYPTLEHYYDTTDANGTDDENGFTYFGITEDMIDVNGTVSFINTYRSHLVGMTLKKYGGDRYRWNNYY